MRIPIHSDPLEEGRQSYITRLETLLASFQNIQSTIDTKLATKLSDSDLTPLRSQLEQLTTQTGALRSELQTLDSTLSERISDISATNSRKISELFQAFKKLETIQREFEKSHEPVKVVENTAVPDAAKTVIDTPIQATAGVATEPYIKQPEFSDFKAWWNDPKNRNWDSRRVVWWNDPKYKEFCNDPKYKEWTNNPKYKEWTKHKEWWTDARAKEWWKHRTEVEPYPGRYWRKRGRGMLGLSLVVLAGSVWIAMHGEREARKAEEYYRAAAAQNRNLDKVDDLAGIFVKSIWNERAKKGDAPMTQDAEKKWGW